MIDSILAVFPEDISRKIFTACLITLFVGLCLLPSLSYAANHAVTNLNDSGAGSLRAAIAAAADTDSITIDPGLTGTIDLGSALPDLNSVTFINGANVTLSRTTGDYSDTPLTIADGKTISGVLPSITTTLTNSGDANTIWGRGSFTLASPLSGTITSSSEQGAYGLVALDSISMNDLSGVIEATSTVSGGAYGVYTLRAGISLNDLSGRITINSANDGFGMKSVTTLTMQNLDGTVDVTAGSDGMGLRSEEDMSINNVTGTIKVQGRRAYGLSSVGALAINDITGTVTANSNSNTNEGKAYGISSFGALSINDVIGTVSAETNVNGSFGLYGGNSVSLNTIVGTISAKAGTYNAFGVYSTQDMSISTLSGTVSAESGGRNSIGIYSEGALNNGAGGSTSISGSVTAQADGLAVAVGAKDGLDLNVSGTLSAVDSSGAGKAYAIASGMANENEWVVGGNVNDTVFLANGASVTGQIELGGGTNTLTLDGAGTLSGAANNITNMVKSSAGTWNTSGKISTVDLDVQAGVLGVEVLGTSSPSVEASGTITNNGEIRFSVEGTVGPGTHEILSAANPLAGGGTYTLADNNSIFLTMAQNANSITLTKDAYADVASGMNSNEQAVAAALDSSADGSTGDFAVILKKLDSSSSTAELGDCVGQLVGVTAETIPTLSTDMARMFSSAAETRMAEVRSYQLYLAQKDDPDPDDPESWPMVAINGDMAGVLKRQPDFKPNGVHLRTLGRSGDMESHGGNSGYDYRTFALSGGYDHMVKDNFLMGVFGGYALTNVDYKDTSQSESKLESYTMGLYATWFKDDWYVNTTLAKAYNKYNTIRPIPFLDRTATSDPTGYTVSAKTSAGQRFAVGDYGLTPMASLEYMVFYQDAYTESGAGAANLSVESISSRFFESGIGSKIDRSWDTSFGRIIPELSVMWMHEWLTQSRNLSVDMTGMPGTVLSQTTAEGANDALVFGAGVRAIHDDGLALTLRYQGEIEEHASSQSLMFEAQMLF